MSDDKPGTPRPDDETQPVRPEGGATLPPPAPTETPVSDGPVAPVAARRGFRERLGTLRRSDGNRTFGLAALIASALAGIIVGGIGVAAVHAVGDDHDRGDWMERHGPMGGDRDGDDGPRGPMFGGPGGGPGGFPGQVQPTTPPDDDDSGSSS